MRYVSKPKRFKRLPHVASVLLCVGLAASSTAQVPANSFYVSIAGADSNRGTTAAAPVRSLAKALTLASASGGGTVKMTTGHFDEATITRSECSTVKWNACSIATPDGFPRDGAAAGP